MSMNLGTHVELRRLALASLLVLAAFVPPPATAQAGGPAVRIQVQPDVGGAPAAPGAVRGLAAAQAAARAEAAKMRGGARRRIEVVLAPGEYTLAQTLQFGPEDSGTVDAPVVYEAEKPDSVIVSGAVHLAGRPGRGRGDPAVFASDRVDPASFYGGGQFYVGGRRAVLARQPNENDYWFVRGAVPQPGESDKDKGSGAFTGTGNAAAWLSHLSPDDRQRAIVEVMQSWTASMHRLEGAPNGETIKVTPHSIWPFMSKGDNQRFFVQNVAAALDAPGEWIGVGREVRYIPRGEDGGKALDGELARLEHLVSIKGDAQGKRLVEHLVFRGLRFEYAAFATPSQPVQDNQAASQVGAAIEVDGAQDVAFEDCGFGHTGAYALWFREDVRNSRVVRSDFYDLGAGAVRIGLTKQPGGDEMATGAITVAGNHIHDTGFVHPGAVAVWVGQSFDNQILHNAIGRTTYTGISVGWSWGYAPATSGRNKVIGNLLYDIGRGQLADMGGIYTLGVSPGTEIANNVIREVRQYEGYGYGAYGLYNDQGSSGITMHDNVVVGTDAGGYFLHFGRDDVLRGNLFALGKAAELRFSKPDAQTNLQIADNVIVPQSRQPFDGKFPPEAVHFGVNALSSESAGGGAEPGPCGGNCQARRIAVQASSDVQDIRLSGADGAMLERFQKIVHEAGPSDGAGGGRRSLAAMPPQPQAPAVPLVVAIDSTPVGQQPPGLHYTPANDLAAIHVEQLPGSPGSGKCLQFNDSPRFEHRSEPSVYALLNHRHGRTTASFDILYDAATQFSHEWRDDGRPFLVGPSLSIDAQGVKAAGRLVAHPKPGQWLHVTVSAGLGEDADGRWSLTLTPQGSPEQRIDNLPLGSPKFARLSWAGVISNAQVASSFCMANVNAVSTGK